MKELLFAPWAMIDSIIVYPVEQFVIEAVVKGLRTIDDNLYDFEDY